MAFGINGIAENKKGAVTFAAAPIFFTVILCRN
jgi:hypothetical protein